jgi:hypothetical protein
VSTAAPQKEPLPAVFLCGCMGALIPKDSMWVDPDTGKTLHGLENCASFLPPVQLPPPGTYVQKLVRKT